MTEREKAVRQINEIAQELVNENELDFSIFRLAHSPAEGCRVTQEISLKTRIIELGSSEGYIAKRYTCSKHNTSSQWVHEDY